MILRVEELTLLSSDYSSAPTVRITWCRHCVFSVVASRLLWESALAVAEHLAILVIVGLIQLNERDNHRDFDGQVGEPHFGERGMTHYLFCILMTLGTIESYRVEV